MRFKPTVHKHFPKAVSTVGGESTSDVIAAPVDAGQVLEAIINRHSTTSHVDFLPIYVLTFELLHEQNDAELLSGS